MKYLILFIIFSNIHGFIKLDDLKSGLYHKKIQFKNCQEFETNKDKLFFLGYAYLFQKEPVLIETLTHPIALKSDNTFFEHDGNNWHNDTNSGTFISCSKNELLFQYSRKRIERKVPLNDVIFLKRKNLYHINIERGRNLENCHLYDSYNKKNDGEYKINYFTDNEGSYYAVGNHIDDALFSYQEEAESLAWHYTIDFDKDKVFRYKGCYNDNLKFSTFAGEDKFFNLKEITFFNPEPRDTLPTYSKPSFASIDPLKETYESFKFSEKEMTNCPEVVDYMNKYNRLDFNYDGNTYLIKNSNFLVRKSSNGLYAINTKNFWKFKECSNNSLIFNSIFKEEDYLIIELKLITFYVIDTVPDHVYHNPVYQVDFKSDEEIQKKVAIQEKERIARQERRARQEKERIARETMQKEQLKKIRERKEEDDATVEVNIK